MLTDVIEAPKPITNLTRWIFFLPKHLRKYVRKSVICIFEHIADIELNGSRSFIFFSRRTFFFLLGYGRVPKCKVTCFCVKYTISGPKFQKNRFWSVLAYADLGVTMPKRPFLTDFWQNIAFSELHRLNKDHTWKSAFPKHVPGLRRLAWEHPLPTIGCYKPQLVPIFAPKITKFACGHPPGPHKAETLKNRFFGILAQKAFISRKNK